MPWWMWLYVAAGLVTACSVYQPSGHVHFDQTTPVEFLALTLCWPMLWLLILMLCVAWLMVSAWDWICKKA